MLNNERGEANYFSTVVFIFIAVLLLAFIIDLFSIISTKQELDHAADQMVKQIQLSGGVNGETDELFEFLSSQIEGAENISYSIDATYTSPRPSGMTNAIQLGTPFFITIEGDAKLGGFWNFDLVNITVVARGSGVSEHYRHAGGYSGRRPGLQDSAFNGGLQGFRHQPGVQCREWTG